MDFQTADEIKLQPDDTKYAVAFNFPIATSTSANDGALAFGTSINSATVTGWYGTTEASDLITGVPTVSGTDTLQLLLDYPTTTMSGVTRTTNMSLKFILTLSDTATATFNYDNVVIKI